MWKSHTSTRGEFIMTYRSSQEVKRDQICDEMYSFFVSAGKVFTGACWWSRVIVPLTQISTLYCYNSNYTNCGTLVLLSTEMNLIFPLSKSVCVYLRYTIIVPSGLISCDCLLFCFRIKEQKSPSSHRESTRRKRLNLITKMHKTQRPALAGC